MKISKSPPVALEQIESTRKLSSRMEDRAMTSGVQDIATLSRNAGLSLEYAGSPTRSEREQRIESLRVEMEAGTLTVDPRALASILVARAFEGEE